MKTVEYYRHTACMFWLKNCQPEKWRDRVDPGQAAARFNFIGMLPSKEEWLKKYASDPEPILVRDDA